MKKLLGLLLLLLASLFVLVHPGRLDENGGHRCYSNCEKYGLKYGEYHPHKPAKEKPHEQPAPADLPAPISSKTEKPPFPYFKFLVGLIAFWVLIRIYQRLSGEKVTLLKLLKGLFKNMVN